MTLRHLLLSVTLVGAFSVGFGADRALAMTPTPTPMPTPTPTATPSPTPEIGEIPIQASAVTASTTDGNAPANTVDNNLATRWAGYGDGAWIRFDLGTPRKVVQMKIAAYRGNERQNRFDIQASDDGTTWTPLLTSHTSGTTTQEELFDLPDTTTRYVRYLGHGSTVGSWNSLTEVSLFTYVYKPTCTVTVSQTAVAVGDVVRVTTRTNMAGNHFTLSVIDSATGQAQDEANPIFTPARPDFIDSSGESVWWELTAVRAGTVTFRVDVYGELVDPVCCGSHFTSASGTSVPVTVGGPAPTPTPFCVTPTPPPTPAPINPAVVGGNGYAVVSWQSAYASTGAHKYELSRATSGSGPWAVIATVDVSGSRDARYTDSAVVNGTAYYYAARELWAWTYGTPPCPVQTFTLRSSFSPIVSTTPGIATGTEITPAKAAVTASTNDGNVPGNTVDNNLSTRWSGNGDGAWLRLDLGTARTVDYVKIGVYRGTERRNKLEIQISSDNMTWTTVWRGESTGLTAAEEIYDIPNQPARYVRYLGHMSNAGTFNSVTEVSVFAP